MLRTEREGGREGAPITTLGRRIGQEDGMEWWAHDRRREGGVSGGGCGVGGNYRSSINVS